MARVCPAAPFEEARRPRREPHHRPVLDAVAYPHIAHAEKSLVPGALPAGGNSRDHFFQLALHKQPRQHLLVVLYHLVYNMVVNVLNIPASTSLWAVYVGMNWLLAALSSFVTAPHG